MKKILTMILITMILSACSLSPVKPIEINTYTINAVNQQKLSKHPNISTILVLRPQAAASLQNKNILYQLKPHELKAFSKNRWIATPAQMLLPLLVQSLENSNYYHAVIASPFTGRTHYRLITKLSALYQDFTQRPSAIVMQMQAILVNTHTQKIIATETFSAHVPAPQNNPYGGVLAANRATKQILTNITRFVVSNS